MSEGHTDRPNWLLFSGACIAMLAITFGLIFSLAVLLASSWRTNTESIQPGMPDGIARAITGPIATDADFLRRTVAAQEAMASFAFWMLVAALFTIVVTTAGTVAIFKQIKFGQHALRVTREGNIQIATNTERQLRAYLTLSYEPTGGTGNGFAFVLHNSGQTPAMNVFYCVNLLYYSNADGIVAEFETSDFDWVNLAASHSHVADVSLPSPFNLPTKKRAPTYDFLMIEIKCNYETVFGAEKSTTITVNRLGWNEFWLDSELSRFD